MAFYQLVIFVLVFIALCLAFKVNIMSIAKADISNRVEDNSKASVTTGKISRFKKSQIKHNKLLSFTGMPRVVYILLFVGCVICGYLLGKLMFKDTLLACGLAVAFTFFPSLYLERESARLTLLRAAQLENSMSIITNAYLANNDIVAVVKENLPLLESKKMFEDFMIQVTYFDSSVDNALLHMASKFPNKFLIQWVDILILTQTDRQMLSVLPTIVEQMNDQRRAQIEANTAMSSAWADYFTLLGMVASFPLIFRIVLYDWYAILVTTTIGKFCMLALIAAIIISFKRASAINKPIVD